MSKTRSRIKLCIVAILTLIGLFFTFVSFVVPTTNTTFNGFINAINYGYDIGGGRLSVYEIADADTISAGDLDEKIDETVRRLKENFSSYGFDVTRQGDTIRIEVSTCDDDEMTTLFSIGGASDDLQTLIGGDEGLSFNDSSSEYDADGSITEEYVESCTLGTPTTSDGDDVYPVTINFTEEGQTKLKEMTQSIVDDSGSLYMYINGTVYNSSGFSLDNAVSKLTLYSTSEKAAQVLQLEVSALAKPVTLSIIVDDTVTAGLNTSTGTIFGNIQMLLEIALALVFVASVIFLLIRYRMLGLLATVANLMFLVLYSFLLQSIPLVLIDINGLIGVVFTYALLFFNTVEIFEKIKAEYASGKRIPNSVTSGFKKSVLSVLERYVFLLILCVVGYIVGSSAIKAFSVALFIGLFVNYFVLFVVLKGMSSSYLVVNSTDRKAYNFKRQEVRNEI
jgi:preprotein translocase subunit SecD